jgi:hypothetical protein
MLDIYFYKKLKNPVVFIRTKVLDPQAQTSGIPYVRSDNWPLHAK